MEATTEDTNQSTPNLQTTTSLPDTPGVGECQECGDPAPIGLYQCAPCHNQDTCTC